MHFLKPLLFLFGIACFFGADATGIGFVENKGQWHENVLYKSELSGAHAFIDRQGITFMHLEDDFYQKLHQFIQGTEGVIGASAHTVKMRFVNGDMNNVAFEYNDLEYPKNYFLGNDTARWASNVRTYERVRISNVYPGIDAHFQSKDSRFKYDFEVAPNANPDQILIEIEGHENLSIIKGALLIQTSVGTFKELKPFAYQLDESGTIEQVSCKFVLNGDELSYEFPQGFDETRKLIIDPEIAFSTFVGSASSNFGFTASYDAEGNLYAGAVVFGSPYPTTAGAFQLEFGQGIVDCGITKFSSDGTDLMYSTYLGGIGNETPHSIVVNEDNELYIFGATSSTNFPTTPNGYQTTFSGGSTEQGVGFMFEQGSDIFITKLNETGAALLGSTYVGGSGNDGICGDSQFDFNYADNFRGEIVIDDAGNAYVASVTASANFPIENGYSSNFTGSLSGIVFKLDSDLEDLEWSTFTGGSGDEVAFSLQLAQDNSVYFAGGTRSLSLPVTANAYQTTPTPGGDGYIGHISANGSELLHCTYNGTSSFEQNYFVQLDTEGMVYVIGQTMGTYPVEGNVYSNESAKQYIQKFSPDLTTSVWSTVVGSTNGEINFAPSAFLVSNCGQIYISGWGGNLTGTGGDMNGLPVTADAFQPGTDGADFYIMVLSPDAEELVYATYFGGSEAAEHVDGGTSRFDKNGTIYQAVCAGCGGTNSFPTTPGVWSQDNPSQNCNLGVFKFELSSVNAIAQIDGPNEICPGSTFNLVNLSLGSDTYLWEFSDGNESIEESLSYSFDEPGTYEISLYAESSDACINPDSTTLFIVVEELPSVTAEVPEPICPGEEMQLNASGNAETWLWFPANNLDDPTIPNPIFTGSNTTTLSAVGFTGCGSDTVEVVAVVGSIDVTAGEDLEICPGTSTTLNANGGISYEWTPDPTLSATNIPNPIATPTEDTVYEVVITTSEGCEVTESVEVSLLPPAPSIEGETEYVSCNSAPVQLLVTGADTWSWSPTNGLNLSSIANPVAQPQSSITYTVTGSNTCGSDELEIDVLVNEIRVSIETDSIVCFNTPFQVRASGAQLYRWQPSSLFQSSEGQEVTAIIQNSTTISVSGIDSLGCQDTESYNVRIFPRAEINAGRDRVISYGESTQLEPFSIYPITWESSPYLSCLPCNFPIADPLETTSFYATIESDFGCVEIDSATVFVRGDIYVPNAFTPDGDGLNDIFKAEGIDIIEFEMQIFNRWGELVFKSQSIDEGWNGSSNGDDYFSQAGVYPYVIVAREAQGEYFELQGAVQLIR